MDLHLAGEEARFQERLAPYIQDFASKEEMVTTGAHILARGFSTEYRRELYIAARLPEWTYPQACAEWSTFVNDAFACRVRLPTSGCWALGNNHHLPD